MTLTEFINRATAFFDKAESAQVGGTDAAKANARIAELEKQAQADKDTITARDNTIKELQAAAEKSGSDIKAKEDEIANLKASLEKEKTRVDETIAGMGVDPKGIPAPKPESADSKNGTQLLAEYNKIESPQERTAFYRKHKAQIDAAWNKTN